MIFLRNILLFLINILLCLIVLISWADASKSSQQIPIQVRRQLATVRNLRDFVKLLKPKLNSQPSAIKDHTRSDSIEVMLFTKTGTVNEPGVELLSTIISEQGICAPKNVSVRLPFDSDPAIVYYPDCVELARCGGCCSHEQLACTPTSTDQVDIVVIKSRYTYDGSGDLIFEGIAEIPMIRHLACDCLCRVQESDCDPVLEEYVPFECRCRCRNEATLANTCSPVHRWCAERCACVCKSVYECVYVHDSVFSETTCKCELSASKSEFQNRLEESVLPPKNPCMTVKCPRPGFVYRPDPKDGKCRCQPPYNNETVDSSDHI